jgi:hypothetical protein
MALTGHPGIDYAIPATNKPVRANGEEALTGWPSNREVEAEVAAWFDAETFEEEMAAVRRLNKAALDHVVLRAAWALPDETSLAQERHWDRARTAAVLLGSQQDNIIFDGPTLPIRRGDCPAD